MSQHHDELVAEGLILGIRIFERLAYLITALMMPRQASNTCTNLNVYSKLLRCLKNYALE